MLAPSDLPPPIGPLAPADDLCGYPSGLEGLGAFAPVQSRYSFHDGLNLRYRGGIQRLFTFFSVWKRTRTTRDGRPYLVLGGVAGELTLGGGGSCMALSFGRWMGIILA